MATNQGELRPESRRQRCAERATCPREASKARAERSGIHRRVRTGGALLVLVLCLAPSTTHADTVTDLLENGQFAQAETELRRLLEASDDPIARDLLGVALSRQGKSTAAEAEFRRALALDPDFFDAHQHLARLYVLGKREAEALERLRAAAALGALDRDLGMKLGVMEMSKGRARAAAEQFRSVAQRFDSVQALLYLVRIEPEEAALGTLHRAQEIAPHSDEVLRTLARANLDGGQPVDAILALESLERMHPSVTEYAYLMGIARLQAGDTAGAVTALRRAVQSGPRRALPLVALGLALNRRQEYDEARQVLEESLRLEPDNVEGLAGLAEAQERLSLLDEAEQNAGRALAREPAHGGANLVLGMLRLRQQRYEEARDALLLAVEADPGSPKAHYQLSLAYARLGQMEESRRHVDLYHQVLDAFEKQLQALGPAASGDENLER